MANDKKGLIVLGAVGVGLYFLAQHSNASGNNPSAPPVGTTTPTSPLPGGTPPTPLEQTQAQITWIYGMLSQNGFKSSPLWYSATSTPTEIPQDTTSAARNLVAKNQSVTDLYQGYFWNVNKFFGWSYPAGSGNSTAFASDGNFAGLTGANVATPDSDPTDWATMQTQYNQLTQVLNPTFLA